MRKLNIIIIVISAVFFTYCTPYDDSGDYRSNKSKWKQSQKVDPDIQKDIKIDVAQTAYIPDNGDSPIVGQKPVENPDAILTFRSIGDKYSVKKGQTVNFIYDGINPEETYILYQSSLDGYNLELASRSERKLIEFDKICQTFVVANPSITVVQVPHNLRYEQVIWTPRVDGSWEVRVGTVERGCKSQALDELYKLRSSAYQKSIPR